MCPQDGSQLLKVITKPLKVKTVWTKREPQDLSNGQLPDKTKPNRRLMAKFLLLVIASLVSSSGDVLAAVRGTVYVHSAYNKTPRLGILIPIGPPNYTVITSRFRLIKKRTYGLFTFYIGSINRIPVVYCIQPFGGEFTRSLTAQSMAIHFNLKALIYPGTSGAHVAPPKMLIGDIVLGAKQVNFGNFFMSKTGKIIPDEFNGVSSMGHYDVLYMNPRLLKHLACAAKYVATTTHIPTWLDNPYTHEIPTVYYYGIQGTSSMWLANKEFINKTDSVFHEMDEDGDWFSAVVAAIYHIPFIEVSTISDSILQLPNTARGIAIAPKIIRKDGGESASVIAQNISDEIAVKFITTYGEKILTQRYRTPQKDPYTSIFYNDPTNPQNLLSGASCS